MPNKFITLLLASFLLTSCASTSDVIPVGKDTYTLAKSSAGMGKGGVTLKAALVKKASKFCAKEEKLLLLTDVTLVEQSVGRPASAEIIFRCLYENDPEYVRPSVNYNHDTEGDSASGILFHIN